MNIVFFDTKVGEKTAYKGLSKDHKLTFVEERLNSDNARKHSDAEIISVFVTSSVTSDLLKLFPNLKLVATRSTGFDHIDLKYCKKNGIEVVNVPYYGENTVAEHAMALLLAITRKILPSVERVKSGSFSRDELEGIDLKGKIIGVIGTGHIGMNLIARAKAFEMKVIAFDLYPNNQMAEKYDFTYVTMDYLLAKSDVISMHVPNTKQTFHMIGEKEIAKMKDSVVLINTSRGVAVDTVALFEALKKKKFYGVGLDVCEDELLLENPEIAMEDGKITAETLQRLLFTKALLKFNRVIMTPHNAYHSKEALRRIQKTTVNNINAYVKGVIENSVLKK